MSSALYNRCCASFLTLSRTIGGFRGGAARDACHQCSSSHSRFFVVFFVVVEPVSLIPLCTGLTAGAAFLTLMGISLEAFRIFGGLLLFLLALEMVQVPGSSPCSSCSTECARGSASAEGVS